MLQSSVVAPGGLKAGGASTSGPMKRFRDSLRKSSDPWRLRREVAAFAIAHGPEAAAHEFGAGVRTVYRLVARLKAGSLAGPDRKSTGRCRDLVKTPGREGPAELWSMRRRMVVFALRSGAGAAAREFGVGVTTVRRWMKRAREGPWRRPGPTGRHLGVAQVEEIVRARLSHPGLGAARLKAELGLPCGLRQIKRVLRDAGLARPYHRLDPEFVAHSAEMRLMLAEMHLVLSGAGRAYGMRRKCDYDPAATLRRIEMLEKVAEKKRVLLERARERERRKAGKGTS